MNEPSPNLPTTNSAKRKPVVSLAIATAFGLGCLPKVPGTFGSLGGIVLAIIPFLLERLAASGGVDIVFFSYGRESTLHAEPIISFHILLAIVLAIVGVWSAHRSANYWNAKDPQKVVIDEVSGQHLALLLGGFWPRQVSPANNPWNFLPIDHPILWATHPLGASMWLSPNWKYLLLGFILFRVFDIWKPFPARQAESLPGGLGIMADDWIAGIYAALGIWMARALGL
jgi:phosphatidylglycerophosphatase A